MLGRLRARARRTLTLLRAVDGGGRGLEALGVLGGRPAELIGEHQRRTLLHGREPQFGQARAFDGIAAWRFDDADLGASDREQTAIRVRGARVTANFFDVLRDKLRWGR